MSDIPDDVPSELIAGDTWRWTRDLSDFPAGTWTLTYYFENQDGTFNVAASASGTTHSVTIAAVTTAAYKAGRYRWRARAVGGGITETVEDGWLDVRPDPAAAGKVDVRSWARRTLDNLLTFLEENAATSQASFAIGTRSAARWELDKLTKWQKELEQKVRDEERGARAPNGRNIKVRYVS